MAIYHLSATVISRSAGRSSTAAAAYRSGTRISDERTGETHDYTRKKGVAHAEIFLPKGAPQELIDRQNLWNTLELSEKRKDAQVAREMNVALPVELDNEQKIELAQKFASSFTKEGMAVDLAIHDIDSQNPHMHLMLSMREVSKDGIGKKRRDWNDRNKIQEWRERWSDMANHALKRAGVSEQIDHRTLAEQGIKKAPSIHLGPTVAAMERRGIQTELGDLNRQRAKDNLKLQTITRSLDILDEVFTAADDLERLKTPRGIERIPIVGPALAEAREEKIRKAQQRLSRALEAELADSQGLTVDEMRARERQRVEEEARQKAIDDARRAAEAKKAAEARERARKALEAVKSAKTEKFEARKQAVLEWAKKNGVIDPKVYDGERVRTVAIAPGTMGRIYARGEDFVVAATVPKTSGLPSMYTIYDNSLLDVVPEVGQLVKISWFKSDKQAMVQTYTPEEAARHLGRSRGR